MQERIIDSILSREPCIHCSIKASNSNHLTTVLEAFCTSGTSLVPLGMVWAPCTGKIAYCTAPLALVCTKIGFYALFHVEALGIAPSPAAHSAGGDHRHPFQTHRSHRDLNACEYQHPCRAPVVAAAAGDDVLSFTGPAATSSCSKAKASLQPARRKLKVCTESGNLFSPSTCRREAALVFADVVVHRQDLHPLVRWCVLSDCLTYIIGLPGRVHATRCSASELRTCT